MQIITKKDIDAAKNNPLPVRPLREKTLQIEEVQDMMRHPVKAQQEMAAKIKVFLDKRMDDEYEDKGYLTDFTRKWIKEYNELLNSIQKNLYGEKSIHLHDKAPSHSDISSFMREHTVIEEDDNTTRRQPDEESHE